MLHWVPSHAGVEENVRADLAARAGTGIGRSPEKKLPHLRSTESKRAAASIKEKNVRLALKVGEFMQSLDQALPGKHLRKLNGKLSKRQAATLSQLRTEKNKLNYYLAKAKIIESATRKCGRESETVGHFLLKCPRWTARRSNLLQAVKKTHQTVVPSAWRVGLPGMPR